MLCRCSRMMCCGRVVMWIMWCSVCRLSWLVCCCRIVMYRLLCCGSVCL